MSARAATRDDRRDMILDAALGCFVAEGYVATSMSTIAARLGRSKAALYNYFRSKEELFEVLVRRCCARFSSGVDLQAGESDLRACLVRLARAYLDHLFAPETVAIQRLVIGESERFPELARLFYDVGPKLGRVRDTELFQAFIDAGLLREEDPARTAQIFKGLVLSHAHDLRLWGVIADMPQADRRRHAEAAVDTFLRAFAPRARCDQAESPDR